MSNSENRNDELEITLDDVVDKPVDGAAEITIDEAPAPKTGDEDWKAQFEAAQKKADDAERLAQQRADELTRVSRERDATRTAVVSAEMLAVENAIANTEHERSDAKAEYKAAMEVGDFDAAAEAQAKLSDIAVRAQRIKEGKAALERRAEDARSQPDPVEQFVSSLSPASAGWVRAHPDVISNRSELERAHYGAVYNKIPLDTPEYFSFLESELGYSARQAAPVAEPRQRQQAAPAAPVSRGGAADAPRTSPNTVRLSAAEREIAAACGMTDAEYARNKLAIQRDSNTTH
jgi:hypothetical protein